MAEAAKLIRSIHPNTVSLRLAHIVNPVKVAPESDLYVAQPVTFETMRIAKEFAAGKVEVEQYSAQYAEDHQTIPSYLQRTPDLERSILDFGTFRKQRKLPLLRDILDRLHAASDAEYFIYTNVDIALMPHFYVTVALLIRQGFDSIGITRRTISKGYSQLDEIPMMWAQVGENHPGRDCFIWRREVQSQFHLENACIGTGGVGKVLLLGQLCTARKWQEFRDLHVTFHLGNDCKWNENEQDDYRAFNLEELRKVVNYYRSNNLLPNNPVLGFIERKGL